MFKKRVFEFIATEDMTIDNCSFRTKILSNIYKYINKINKDVGTKIHEEGYRYNGKQYYKPFTTHLDLGDNNFSYWEKVLVRRGKRVKFIVSGINEYVDIISNGIENDDLLNISNKLFMYLREIEIEDKELNEGAYIVTTLAPVSITTKNELNKKIYIPIRDEELYFQKIYENLCRKYESFYGEAYNSSFGIKYLANIGYKGHKIEIKKVKNKDGKLVSHNEIMYDFSMIISSDDKKMINLIKYIGLGGKNAYGFGYVDLREV